jgi:diacylglycerol O-acyltransferase
MAAGRSRPPDFAPTMDHVLSYIDQASFMGLRALGRGPVIEWSWVLDHPLHADDIEDFNHRLAQGPLGRLVQRSSVPGGRHRWVANRVPPPIVVATEAIGLEQLPQWRRSLLDLPVDPEHGPGWRLVAQPLVGGGTALALLVSHTIADGLGVVQALCEAAADMRPSHAYRPRSPRASWRNVVRDAGVSARSLPDTWKAIALLVRRARGLAAGVSSSVARSAPPPSRETALSADVSLVQMVLDERACRSRASALGVPVNTLLAALAARLGFRLGRVDADGRVKLVMPISDRTPGDLRANALRSITVMVDPVDCCARPQTLRSDLRSALDSLRTDGDDSPILALIPYVPLALARRLEGMALGAGLTVGCSLLGELDPAVNRPCGTEAVRMHTSLLERHTVADLDQLGGKLQFVAYRLAGTICIDVACWAPTVIASRDDLITMAERALGDVALTGAVR